MPEIKEPIIKPKPVVIPDEIKNDKGEETDDENDPTIKIKKPVSENRKKPKTPTKKPKNNLKDTPRIIPTKPK